MQHAKINGAGTVVHDENKNLMAHASQIGA